MSTNPHRARHRPVIGVVTATMALVGGCANPKIEPHPMPTFGSSTTSTTPPPGPVKYAFASFASCPEIQQKVTELPTPLRPERGEGPDRFSQTCTFTKQDVPYITFRVELYENTRDAFGTHSGAERAKQGFHATPQPGAEKDDRVNIGSVAQWADTGGSQGCKLEVLDENAVMILSYVPVQKNINPRSEQCRASARDLARQLYAAVQPR